ncbi:MAG: hypothetical protein ACM37W_24555 [Actinomycetota bacterium]
MTTEFNQQPVVCQNESMVKLKLEAPNSSEILPTVAQINNEQGDTEAKEPDALKAFARALMVSLTWSMAGLTTRKKP